VGKARRPEGGPSRKLTACWTGVGVFTLAALIMAVAFQPAARAGHRVSRTATCRAPGSLSGSFSLSNQRRVKAKRTNCRTASKVVKGFPQACSDAYAAQGGCKIRASARWQCKSRIIGALEHGAPSKETCKHRRSTLKFEVTYSPLIDGPGFGSARGKQSGPFDLKRDCIKTNPSGQVIPPPPLAEAPFEIHVLNGVSKARGRALQRSLLDHQVAKILNRGLSVQPRSYPKRLPILLTPHGFGGLDAWAGVTKDMCDNPAADAIVFRTDTWDGKIEPLVAHELFHAYSDAINTTETWWEEASATWSQHKVGYPEADAWDIALQYPNKAIDTTESFDPKYPPFYPYAMSRFVQFLDDKGFIGAQDWPMHRSVIFGYSQVTRSVDHELNGRGSSLGEQAAAFWGDRIRAHPLHGPQLRPGPGDGITVRSGTKDYNVTAAPLHTQLRNFTLGGGIKRVEFEFDAPADGWFWGAPKRNESQRFPNDESVAFCVDAASDDDLEWPGQFPVTFTNGALNGHDIKGTITVHAQTNADQCKNPNQNRACRALNNAAVQGVLGLPLYDGEDGFAGSSSNENGHPTVDCAYVGKEGVGTLDIARWRSARDLRKHVRKACEILQCQPLELGSVAGIRDDGNHAVVLVALGHDGIGMTVTNRSGAGAAAILLVRRVVQVLE